MKKLALITCIVLLFNNTYSQSSKIFNLNSYHDYPTYVDIQFTDKGRSLGDDIASSYVQNISNYKISFGVEFTIKDYCGNSKTFFWPGGLNLKAGERASWPWALTAKCNELSEKKFGIASVTCRITSFKNITLEAQKN